MADELFNDLLGPTPGSSVSGKAPAVAPASSTRAAYPKIRPINVVDEEGSSAGSALGVAEVSKATVTLTAEDLSALVEKGIETALEATFSKFVRSLRTVLEDVTRRISSQEATAVELRAAIADLREAVTTQPEDLHIRFTNLDMAIKEVERGVQALRDRQELIEAQELLARMSADTSRTKGHTSTAGAPAVAAPPVSTPPAAEAPAPATAAPAAPAPSLAPAPSSAPLAAASPAPAVPAAAPAAPGPPPPVAPQAPAAPTAAAPMMPVPQQAPYGTQQGPYSMPFPQQATPAPTHMPAPAGYPIPGPIGVPGAPPLPMPHQQQPQQGPAEQQQQQLQPQPQPQPHQQPHMQAPQYPYQLPPQQLGGMPPPPDAGPYTALQQQQQQPAHAPHLPQVYPAPYGSMLGMDAPPRAPAMPTSHGMPPPPTPPPAGGGGAGPAPGAVGDLRGGPPPLQMVSYPPPPSGIHGYPAPSSVMPGVSVPSMYARPTAPAAGYRGSSQPQPSTSGGGGSGPTGSRTVPLDKIIADISQMGFSRGDVLSAVNSLQSSGKALDLNTIIDKLTRG